MDNRLLQAGIIAIPIKPKPESELKPMPTHIVFNEQSGRYDFPQINFTTGQIEQMDCVKTTYSIVARSILYPTESRPQETYIERVLQPSEDLYVPVDLLTTFFSYERIKANVGLINTVLSLFVFRGDLEGFVMEVDEGAVDEILSPPVTPVPVETPVPAPVPVETPAPAPVPVETPVPSE